MAQIRLEAKRKHFSPNFLFASALEESPFKINTGRVLLLPDPECEFD